jgi:hypothetical protein
MHGETDANEVTAPARAAAGAEAVLVSLRLPGRGAQCKPSPIQPAYLLPVAMFQIEHCRAFFHNLRSFSNAVTVQGSTADPDTAGRSQKYNLNEIY